MKLIMCKGLPASGKTTWANLLLDGNTVIVDSDEIRTKQFGNYKPEYEDFVQIEKYSQIRKALKAGKTVISTDPNLLPKHEAALYSIARKHGAVFQIQKFDTPIDECIRRDALREKPVGATAIRYWAKKAGIQQ